VKEFTDLSFVHCGGLDTYSVASGTTCFSMLCKYCNGWFFVGTMHKTWTVEGWTSQFQKIISGVLLQLLNFG